MGRLAVTFVDAVLERQFPQQPVPVGGLVIQAGWFDGKVGAADAGIELAVKLGGQGDALGADGLGDELDLDLFPARAQRRRRRP